MTGSEPRRRSRGDRVAAQGIAAGATGGALPCGAGQDRRASTSSSASEITVRAERSPGSRTPRCKSYAHLGTYWGQAGDLAQIEKHKSPVATGL